MGIFRIYTKFKRKKMIKMKKNSVFLLVILLVFSMMLWSCGGSEPVEQPEEGAETTTEDVSNEAEETEEESVAQSGDEITENQLASLFGKGQELTEVYYEMEVTSPGFDTTRGKIWLKGDRMKSESQMMGENFVMIYDVDAIYMLEPADKTAVKMPMEMGIDEMMDPITVGEVTEDMDEETLEYLGREEYEGILCHVVLSTDQEYDIQTKMWLHPDYGFPMKVEGLSDDPEEQYVMKISNFEVGNVSDSVFQIPSDYEIVDMAEMFQ